MSCNLHTIVRTRPQLQVQNPACVDRGLLLVLKALDVTLVQLDPKTEKHVMAVIQMDDPCCSPCMPTLLWASRRATCPRAAEAGWPTLLWVLWVVDNLVVSGECLHCARNAGICGAEGVVLGRSVLGRLSAANKALVRGMSDCVKDWRASQGKSIYAAPLSQSASEASDKSDMASDNASEAGDKSDMSDNASVINASDKSEASDKSDNASVISNKSDDDKSEASDKSDAGNKSDDAMSEASHMASVISNASLSDKSASDKSMADASDKTTSDKSAHASDNASDKSMADVSDNSFMQASDNDQSQENMSVESPQDRYTDQSHYVSADDGSPRNAPEAGPPSPRNPHEAGSPSPRHDAQFDRETQTDAEPHLAHTTAEELPPWRPKLAWALQERLYLWAEENDQDPRMMDLAIASFRWTTEQRIDVRQAYLRAVRRLHEIVHRRQMAMFALRRAQPVYRWTGDADVVPLMRQFRTTVQPLTCVPDWNLSPVAEAAGLQWYNLAARRYPPLALCNCNTHAHVCIPAVAYWAPLIVCYRAFDADWDTVLLSFDQAGTIGPCYHCRLHGVPCGVDGLSTPRHVQGFRHRSPASATHHRQHLFPALGPSPHAEAARKIYDDHLAALDKERELLRGVEDECDAAMADMQNIETLTALV